MVELFTFVLFPLAALLLALAAISGSVIVSGMAIRWRGYAFSALIMLLTVSSILSIVLSKRQLTLGEQGLMNISEGDAGSGLVAKLLLMTLVASSIALCLAWFFDFNKKLTGAPRYLGRGLMPPRDATVAFMLFFIAFSLLPIPLGKHYYFHISLVYPLFVYFALFSYMQLSDFDPALILKYCLGMLVFASLIAAVATPNSAFQPGYVGLIPGFSRRLWGVTAHANSLGAVACAYVLMELAVPSKRRWVGLLVLGAAWLTLLLTQSKTSILSAMFGSLIITGNRIWRYVSDKGQGYNRSGSLFLAMLLGLACMMIVVLGGWMMFADSHLLRTLERNLDARAVGDLSTGTGRLWIWHAALNGGMENPLFGQGAGFWNLENRLRLGLSGAVTAHNQYLQVFSRSGLVGVVGLLGFLGVYIRYALRAARATSGASIAMLLVLLARSITEVPIAPNAILGAEFFATMAYLFYVIDRGARAVPPARVPAQAVSERYARGQTV